MYRSDGTALGAERKRIAHRGATAEMVSGLDSKKRAMAESLSSWLGSKRPKQGSQTPSPTKSKSSSSSSPVAEKPATTSGEAGPSSSLSKATASSPRTETTSSTVGKWLQKPGKGTSLVQQQLNLSYQAPKQIPAKGQTKPPTISKNDHQATTAARGLQGGQMGKPAATTTASEKKSNRGAVGQTKKAGTKKPSYGWMGKDRGWRGDREDSYDSLNSFIADSDEEDEDEDGVKSGEEEEESTEESEASTPSSSSSSNSEMGSNSEDGEEEEDDMSARKSKATRKPIGSRAVGSLRYGTSKQHASDKQRRKIVESNDEEEVVHKSRTTGESKLASRTGAQSSLTSPRARKASEKRIARSERCNRRAELKHTRKVIESSDEESQQEETKRNGEGGEANQQPSGKQFKPNGNEAEKGDQDDEADDSEAAEEKSYDSADSDAAERRKAKHAEILTETERQCLANINELPMEELKLSEKFSEKLLKMLVEKRPFESFSHLAENAATVPRGPANLDSYLKYLEKRSLLDRVLDDCRKQSSKIRDELERTRVAREEGSEQALLGINPSCQLHFYQQVGVQWLVMMSRLGLDAILADEMGLGKTIQVISFLAWAKATRAPNVKGPHLIVVPSSTIENWRTEIELWAPHLTLLTYYGSIEERQALRAEITSMGRGKQKSAFAEGGSVDLILTTYNMVGSRIEDRAFFRRFPLNYVIYDEGHMLRSCNTQRYRQLMRVGGRRRILLTGTPLQNNLVELISLLYFTMPQLFAKYFDRKNKGETVQSIAPLLQMFAHKGKMLKQEKAQPRVRRSSHGAKRTSGKKSQSPKKNKQRGGEGEEEETSLPQGEEDQREVTPLEERPLYEQERIAQAKGILEPFVLRRLKAQVLADCLPPKHEHVVLCETTPQQDTIYAELLEEIRAEREAKEEGAGGGSNGGGGGNAGWLMRMRQAANHPLLHRQHYDDAKLEEMARLLCAKERAYKGKNRAHVAEDLSYESDIALHSLCSFKYPTVLGKFRLADELSLESGKCRQLDIMLPSIFEKHEKVLIFSQFTSQLDILEMYLRHRHWQNSYCRLDGSTPVLERQQLINAFNSDPQLTVFLLSTKAGGLGINLTSANHIILHDIDFNPYNDRQAEDRCHRLGQRREVHVTRLLSRGTIEEPMWALSQRKLELERDVTTSATAGNTAHGTESTSRRKIPEADDAKTIDELLTEALMEHKG